MKDYRKEITDQVKQTMMIATDGRCPVPVPLAELIIGQMVEDASNLKDCVNELCLKCGNYHESYLGACDGCRWKAVKEGFR
jgi:7-cyano-7-deazaguanine synthase in queuosine biosynthesis